MIAVISTLEGVTEAGSKVMREGKAVLKKAFPDLRFEYWSSTSGKLGTVRIVWWHASLAAKEAFDARFFANTAVQKVFTDAGPGPYWASQRDDYVAVDQD